MGLLIVTVVDPIINSGVVVLGDLRLNELDLVPRQPVPLVELGVRPFLTKWKVRDESVDVASGVLS